MAWTSGVLTGVLATGVALLAPLAAHATQIRYDVQSLGGNRWSYTYEVQNEDLIFGASTTGFSIFFDASLYANMAAIDAAPGWDVLILQPDSGLPDAGLYDALATVDFWFDSLNHFSVSFDWLGDAGSPPASQPWQVYELDSLGDLIPLQEGTTVLVPVPELDTGALLVTGLGILAVARRRR